MHIKRDYKQVFDIVQRVILAWDPYALVSHGAPPNEFDQEVAQIVARVPKCRTESDVSRAVSEIFSQSFSPDDFSLDKCHDIGVSLFAVLRDSRYV